MSRLLPPPPTDLHVFKGDGDTRRSGVRDFTYSSIHVYMYIYTCGCVRASVCAEKWRLSLDEKGKKKKKNTINVQKLSYFMYIYVYTYIVVAMKKTYFSRVYIRILHGVESYSWSWHTQQLFE